MSANIFLKPLLWYDTNATPYNTPTTYLVANELASYTQHCINYGNNEEDEKLNNWMEEIKKAVLSFSSLEKKTNNPETTPEELQKSIHDWDTSIQDILNKIDNKKYPHRMKGLMQTLKNKITSLKENYLNKFEHFSDSNLPLPRAYLTAHDIEFDTPSLGRFISDAMNEVLKTGIKGAYYLSPTPLMNAWRIHPSIQALSDAKKKLALKSYALYGLKTSNPFVPIQPSLLERLEGTESRFAYTLPRNNPKKAERLVSLAFNLPIENFSGSLNFSQSCFFYVAYAFSFILEIILLILFRLPAALFNNNFPKIISPLHHLHQWQSEKIKSKWNKKLSHREDADAILKYLNESLIRSHFFEDVAKFIREGLYGHENMLESDHEEKNPIQYHSCNQLSSPFDAIGHIIRTLDNEIVNTPFRHSPAIATLSFAATLFSFGSYLVPSLTPSFLLGFNHYLLSWINSITMNYTGVLATTSPDNMLIGCFLFWQTTVSLSQGLINFSGLQENLHPAGDWLQNPSKGIIAGSFLTIVGYVLGFIPKIENQRYLPFVSFINFLSNMSRDCRNSGRPMVLTTYFIIAVKSLYLLADLFNLVKHHHIEKTIDNIKTKDTLTPLNSIHLAHPYQKIFLSLPVIFSLSSIYCLSLEHYQNSTTFLALAVLTRLYFSSSSLNCLSNHRALKSSDTKDDVRAINELSALLKKLKEPEFQHQFKYDFFYTKANTMYSDLKDKLEKAGIQDDVLLDNFFRQYCIPQPFNFLKIILLPMSPILYLLGYSLGYVTNNNYLKQWVSVFLQENVLMLCELVYYVLHPVAELIKTIWNNLILGGLRCLWRLIYFFLPEDTYYAIDDALSNCKIHEQANQLLHPLQVLVAKLASVTGHFNIVELIDALLEKLQNQETIQEEQSLPMRLAS